MKSQRSLLEPGGMPQAAPQAQAGGDYERGRLAVEIPISTHHFTAGQCFTACAKLAIIGIILLVISQVLLFGAFQMFESGTRSGAAGAGGVGVVLLIGGLVLLGKVIGTYSGKVSHMEVCHSGLRWIARGQKRMALWTEIANINRSEAAVVYDNGEPMDWHGKISIGLRTGEVLRLNADTLSNFVGFANAVAQFHAQTVQTAGHNLMNAALSVPFTTPRPR